MPLSPLITVNELVDLEPNSYVLFDVRFDLKDHEAGRRAYAQGHLPNAHFVELESDLSVPVGDGSRGRHPLPEPQALAQVFARLGVSGDTRVIAYDAGANVYPARLWWSLIYLGHNNVQVLDGGVAAWSAGGHALTTDIPPKLPRGTFEGQPRPEMVVEIDDIPDAGLLVDSREPPRYRGEVEPVDPVAGHIPGAVNHFFGNNLEEGKGFADQETLRRSFDALLNGKSAAQCVFYCGSGVSACNNLLAMAHAGLGVARLYPGSWSEWCQDPGRPVARGTES